MPVQWKSYEKDAFLNWTDSLTVHYRLMSKDTRKNVSIETESKYDVKALQILFQYLSSIL